LQAEINVSNHILTHFLMLEKPTRRTFLFCSKVLEKERRLEWVIEHSQNLDQGMLLDCTVRDVLRKFAVINQVKAQSGGDILSMFKEGASGQSRVDAYTYGHEAEDFRNIRIVDDGVSHLSNSQPTTSMEMMKKTSRIFTADHGMSDWGSHGAGQHFNNTHTPLVA